MTTAFLDLKPETRRALVALWLSMALHAAVIGTIHLSPRAVGVTHQVLEVRLESKVPTPPQQVEETLLLPSLDTPETVITISDVQPVVLQNQLESKPEARSEPVPEPVAISSTPEQARPNNPEPAKPEMEPTMDIPLAVDTHYYSAKELDVQPRPVSKIEPAYPSEYELQGVSGYAIVEMRIESDGEVSDLKLIEVFPPGYDDFGQEALKAFRNARFIPAMRNGQSVRALFKVKVTFELTE